MHTQEPKPVHIKQAPSHSSGTRIGLETISVQCCDLMSMNVSEQMTQNWVRTLGSCLLS